LLQAIEQAIAGRLPDHLAPIDDDQISDPFCL